MKPTQARTPKFPRHEASGPQRTCSLGSEAVARYARACLLAHPDLVLKVLREKQKPATKPAEFITNPLSGQ